MLSSWRALYGWLLRRREIASDPGAGLRSPKAPRRLPSVLSPEEATSLVSAEADGDEGIANRALFELAYSSGLRVSELVFFVRPVVLANNPVLDNSEAMRRVDAWPSKEEVRKELDPRYVPPKKSLLEKILP